MEMNNTKQELFSIFKKHTQKQPEMLFDPEHQHYYSTEDKLAIKKLIVNSQFETKYRKEYYMIASGAYLSLAIHPNYYNDILNNFPVEIPFFDSDKILLDINRTFPYNPEFSLSKGEEKLGRILLAFIRRNPSIGYCQGFNYIAGRALLITQNEEEAFWLFTHIMEDLLPLNYFTNLYGITIDHNIVLFAVQKKFKETFAHLHEASYDFFIDNLIDKWLLTLFFINVNEGISYLIWDLLMIDQTILIKAPISLVKLFSEEIEKINLNENDAVTKLPQLVTCISNQKLFLQYVLMFDSFSHSALEVRRKKDKTEPTAKPQDVKGKDKKELERHCNPLWNVCIANSNIHYEIKEYIIHRAHLTPKVYENYFNWRDNSYNSVDTNTNDNYFEMLIERIPHKCQSQSRTDTSNANGKEKV